MQKTADAQKSMYEDADMFFMKKAVEEARKALDRKEFPVGCVLVSQGRIISSGSRQGTARGGKNETGHAEMIALRRMEEEYPDTDKSGVSLYCTMEPCLMCYGAALISGIGRIVYAYEDAMGGGTSCDLSRLPPLYRDSPIAVRPGILRQESLALFQAFFKDPENDYWKDSLLAHYTLEQKCVQFSG